jgi:single-stranded-DNA-specific exonuclease
MGNPGVRLMVPSAKVGDVRTMGQEGKHARFSLHSGGHRALGVAFGRSALGVEEDEAVDAAVRLEVNHWNGSVEPRVVLRELYPVEVKADAPAAAPHACVCADAEWWTRFELELRRELPGPAEVVVPLSPERTQRNHGIAEREVVAPGGAVNAAIAELVSSGAGVLAVCADASRRAVLAGGASGLARFNGGSGRVACMRCGRAAIAGVIAKASGGLALTDYATLAAQPVDIVSCFEHVVLVDPPPSAADEARAVAPLEHGLDDTESPDLEIGAFGKGFVHRLWTGAEAEFTIASLEAAAPSRATIASAFRRLRDAGEASGEALRTALSGPGPYPLAPETAARCLRVLRELDLVRGEPNSGDGVVGVVSSEGTDLERSAAFRSYSDEFSETRQFLERPKLP